MSHIECVAEFATGDPSVADTIAAAATSAGEAIVLRRLVDADVGRSALILLTPVASTAAALLAAIEAAREAIDLGASPLTATCTGAAECITLTALGDTTPEQSVAVAGDVARRAAAELSLPAYVFGAAAVRPTRKDVTSIRELGRDALAARVGREAELAPDFGDAALHATAGCVFIGARDHQVEYGVELEGVAAPTPVAANVSTPSADTEDPLAAPLPFLDALAAKTPLPGGGCAAALAGASAAALVEMVANLTVGRKRYADVQDQMEMIQATAAPQRAALQGLIRSDAEAYEAYMAAVRLPKQTQDEQAARTASLAEAALGAAVVPLEVARRAVTVLELAARAAEKGNRNAASDGGVGALLARAAARGAALNVLTNLSGIAEEDDRTRLETEARELLARAEELERRALVATGMDLD